MKIYSPLITGSVTLNNINVNSITGSSGFATTSSINTLTAATGSYATTSSFGAYTASNDLINTAQNTRLTTIESVTGSYATTSSFGAYSSSINTFTSSANTRLSTIESVTGSYATTSSINALIIRTGSYATTGSNQFNGNQSISGSIVSNGTITAQTLVVQTISSSIEFVTGSTRNGSLPANTHEFTGSVGITGSLQINGVASVVGSGAANELVYWVSTNSVGTLSVTIYPSLTELSYVKGVTSAIQTQINTKQATVTLTTTGTSGVATFSANTLNIPNYGSALSGYLPLTGGTLTGALTGTSANFSGNVGIGSSINPTYRLEVSADGGSQRIRVGTLQNNSNTSTFEAITTAGNTTASSAWFKANAGGSASIGTSSYTKVNGDSGNFANISSEVSTTAMTITSAGNVGIGTTSPSQALHLSSSSAVYCRIFNTNGADIYLGAESTQGVLTVFNNLPIDIRTNNITRIFATSGGNVLIGTTTDSGYKLDVNGGVAIRGKSILDANGYFICGSAGYRFNNSGDTSNLAIILNNGNVLIGSSTDNGEKLFVTGAIRATGTITANSDIRIKSNILKIKNALEKVSQINGYTYNTNYDDNRHGGVIAQEIQKVFPEIVNTGNDGMMGVEYGNISALLIEAIKELSTENNSLKEILTRNNIK